VIVIDAKVAAKWLLPEDGSSAAIDLQEGPDQLLAPELIRLEVCAAITRRVRDPKTPIPADAAEQRCRIWLGLLAAGTVELIPDQELLDEAIRLSVKVKHALQDCLYLAASVRHHATLVTADETFYKRTAAAFPNVRPLLPLAT
jgi:predicted nucleic acid-binding protein